MAAQVLRLPDVKQRVCLSRSSIYLAISKGTFPSPIPLGIRSVGWLESDVERWIQERAMEKRPSK
jgi:prophage regulatory protein